MTILPHPPSLRKVRPMSKPTAVILRILKTRAAPNAAAFFMVPFSNTFMIIKISKQFSGVNVFPVSGVPRVRCSSCHRDNEIGVIML
jgi:hypothetical protein